MIGKDKVPKQICPECGLPVYQSHGKVTRHRKCQGKHLGAITKQRWKERVVNAEFGKPILRGETMRSWLEECEGYQVGDVIEIELVKMEIPVSPCVLGGF